MGDYWLNNHNHKFIYLGSGLEGSPVPEIPGGMGLALLFGFGLSYFKRKALLRNACKKVFLLVFIMISFFAVPSFAWVEWNNHYYEVFSYPSNAWTWGNARSFAQTYLGGDLACVTSSSEKDFLVNTFGSGISQTFIGGYQPAGSAEPYGSWTWVSGESWSYTNWATGLNRANPNEPNNGDGSYEEDVLVFINQSLAPLGTWSDIRDSQTRGAVVERQPERCPTIWQYIWNGDSTISESWDFPDTDSLYSSVAVSHSSTIVDGRRWYYTSRNFGTTGWWGSGQGASASWTDSYGFKHLYYGSSSGMTTFDRSVQWEYIANADRFGSFAGTVDWNLGETDTLTGLSSSGASASVDSVPWRYMGKNYNATGWWGSGQGESAAWTDSYGFRHINLVGSTRGISDFNRSSQWEYIANADRIGTFAGTVDWTLGETDTLTSVDTNGESASVDGVAWKYMSKNYNATGWWGAGQSEGTSWTDSYGFKHINLVGSTRGISNFDRSSQWEYVANADKVGTFAGLVDWDLSQTDTLTAVDTNGESANVDGVAWKYMNKNYNNTGWWGSGQSEGASWTDSYGFKHINIQANTYGISNFDRSVQWGYVANADRIGPYASSVDWDLTQTDTLTGLDTTGETASVDSVAWKYMNKNYNNAGWWGTGETEGTSWTDSYGFKHINMLANTRGISNFDRSIQWEYIANADVNGTFGSVDWNLSEVDAMVALDTAGESTNVDGTVWRYMNKNYSNNGFWGLGETVGNGWTDKYGYKHIYLDNGTRGISTFDKDITWERIGKAGYSADFSETFNEDWTKEEVQILYNLYQSQTGMVKINGFKWKYTGEDFSTTQGKTLGDYWTYGTRKYIYLGSGLEGFTTPEIPGGMTLALLFGLGVSYLRRMKK
ncbi:PEP motif putative anchor domain-containing protein [Candidatus Omnitrophus magneticus]|uniref:PEP motif putative anchor domain-containing protein n=1 Tax=Candidatus Omnitrophus magneticus TaxID=1609969 RepID=A0A0F0CQV4_9BACT|nr:PEP motif putative anchor domain-containing protein [Candidatus Omnitrophus magneticus]